MPLDEAPAAWICAAISLIENAANHEELVFARGQLYGELLAMRRMGLIDSDQRGEAWKQGEAVVSYRLPALRPFPSGHATALPITN